MNGVASLYYRLGRAVAPAMLAIGMLPAAYAHTAFSLSSPADGAVLSSAPASFTIEFSESIELKSVRLSGADGTHWPIDWARKEQRVIDAKFRSLKPLPPGKYVIDWAAVVASHDDGGAITFSVAP
jgi:methionine-rich copper-binding protein CopC